MRHAEICKDIAPIAIEEHIGWLDIEMEDGCSMRRVQSREEIRDEAPGAVCVELPDKRPGVGEAAARKILRHRERRFAIELPVVELRDSGCLDRYQGSELALQKEELAIKD